MKYKRCEIVNNDPVLATYEFKTVEEGKILFDKFKQEFRERNGIDKIISMGGIDKSYDEFCETLDDTLKEFAENFDPDETRISRNIRMAREIRERKR